MYRRGDGRGYVNPEFLEGLEYFLNFAYSRPQFVFDGKIKCPCSKCRNTKNRSRDDVQYHVAKNGFVGAYTFWHAHGEMLGSSSGTHTDDDRSDYGSRPVDNTNQTDDEDGSNYRTMVMDAMGQVFPDSVSGEAPNPEAQHFYEMLKDAEEPLWDGCRKHTKLSAVSQLLNLKSESNMSESTYNRMMCILKDMLPDSAQLPADLYQTKKIFLKTLNLGYEKIDACVNNCVLYYKENEDLLVCPTCSHPRYKARRAGARKPVAYKILRYMPLIPRLQRLYASSNTSEHMCWHKENQRRDGRMAHPCDGEAWKNFDRLHQDFGADPRNVRLGLCTDGFSPFGMGATPYSCWPVILTVYNLPPWMCFQKPFMFLNMVIPGPKGPGKNLDVFLRPLIDELRQLWECGVPTYDAFRKQNFQMRAALLWTISDFPAYGMLCGWSTHGKFACPYCMENTKSDWLQVGRKHSWFDCHRQFLPPDHPYRDDAHAFTKGRTEGDAPPERMGGHELRWRIDVLPDIVFGVAPFCTDKIHGFGQEHNWTKKSIFWELPYWHTNLIRHNLDVMHIEKNFFDNIFNTVMDVKDKSKDNAKARVDLAKICDRASMHLIHNARGRPAKPRAPFTLAAEQKREVCRWAKSLRLPDGYSANISRRVNMDECRFYGMKSHDCHVFMQRLLPIAFRDVLPAPIWEALAQISGFFRDLCATVLRVPHIEQLESNIVEILCRLEKIFPPAFFDVMEHLPIHLPYEAKVGGPVQYRWMYPFER